LATLIATVPIAVLTFQFDPYTELFGGLMVLRGTLALIAVILIHIILNDILAR